MTTVCGLGPCGCVCVVGACLQLGWEVHLLNCSRSSASGPEALGNLFTRYSHICAVGGALIRDGVVHEQRRGRDSLPATISNARRNATAIATTSVQINYVSWLKQNEKARPRGLTARGGLGKAAHGRPVLLRHRHWVGVRTPARPMLSTQQPPSIQMVDCAAVKAALAASAARLMTRPETGIFQNTFKVEERCGGPLHRTGMVSK